MSFGKPPCVGCGPKRHADPFGALLGVLDRVGKKRAPQGHAVLGTITSLSPFTVTLDTGQVIVNPVAMRGTV